jgi:hypothetical protein
MPRRSPARLTLLTLLLLTLAAGCAKSAPNAAPASTTPPTVGDTAEAKPDDALAHADVPSADRKVIRTAELWLESDAPDATCARITALAAARHGFVLSTDATHYRDDGGGETTTATLVFRVPAGTFDEALAATKALGTHVSDEKVTGQDVTEEYVDLESRLRAQRAVEEQYLSVLKEAKSIQDVLAVQQKLGEVRTEIERAEGRRRFLENQTSLSTVTVHVSKHTTAVETSGPGFGRSLREAEKDVVNVSVAILNGAIRLVGVLLPVMLLIVAPIVFAVRAWMRRR